MDIVNIIIAMASVTLIGLICAILLSIVSKLMIVKVDERVAMIRESLPGVNCGVCGFSGCDSYAAALVSGDVATNLCKPGKEKATNRINEILGA